MPDAITLILPYGKNICLFPISDIDFGTCVGYAKTTRTQCRNPIVATVRTTNKAKILKLAADGKGSGRVLDGLAENLLCKGVHQKESHQISAIWGALKKALKISTTTRTPEQSAIRISTNNSNPPKVSTAPLAPWTIIQGQSPTSEHHLVSSHREQHTIKQAEELHERVKQSPLTIKWASSGFVYVYRYPDVEGILKLGYSWDIEARIYVIKRQCDRKPMLITDANQRAVQHIYRAEQLVLAKLAHCQLKEIECHVQFFLVPKAKALKAIQVRRQETYSVAESKKPLDRDEDKVHSQTRISSHPPRVKKSSFESPSVFCRKVTTTGSLDFCLLQPYLQCWQVTSPTCAIKTGEQGIALELYQRFQFLCANLCQIAFRSAAIIRKILTTKWACQLLAVFARRMVTT
jgi:T5orf172 domain